MTPDLTAHAVCNLPIIDFVELPPQTAQRAAGNAALDRGILQTLQDQDGKATLKLLTVVLGKPSQWVRARLEVLAADGLVTLRIGARRSLVATLQT